MKKLLLVFLSLSLFGCEGSNPVLTIEGGKIQGVKAETRGVFVYRGIPYAAPPIRELRWKAPQPVIPWEGVRIADTFGHPCFQAAHYPGGYTTEWGYGDEAAYSEDCLYLNVWTKAPGQTGKKLPVALWIFGGGLREGWGSEPEFDGEAWAGKDVVLVTFNYRLGVFGFLTHPELAAENPEHVSGNYGILDQIEALRWVKKNIAQFGGDPDNVMIFGQSAGGRSTKTLCASPLARGLFNKAIIMSASGLTLPVPAAAAVPSTTSSYMRAFAPLTLEESSQQTKQVMDWAGLTDLEKMRAASTEVIFALGPIYQSVTGNLTWMSSGLISPVVDGYVLEEDFDNAAVNNNLANVPYMIGFTLNDMGNMAPGIIDFCVNREQAGDRAYAYQFARRLPTDGRDNVLKGAFHSSDLWYVFQSFKNSWRPWTEGDWNLSEEMLTAWTNFAKFGDPNGRQGGEWTPCTGDNPRFMIFKLDENDVENSEMG
ncbi:MAG: carboxylesterase family protein, partial [Bacteroidales bacterium]|nr:carboxylesterase family protein [Bacteroidales bacterium]